jgi:hypothetical protein
MVSYFETKGFREDFTNLLKSIVLISNRLGEITHELSEINDTLKTFKEEKISE